jgi:hypothetical protein
VVKKFESIKKEVYFSSKYSSPFGKSFSVNTEKSLSSAVLALKSPAKDVLIGVVYIPPEFTSYSSQEAFNDIDFNIRNLSRSYKYISLAGDFNARTAELKDFSVFTENDFPNGDEYLLEKYTSFLTDSNLFTTK